MATNVTFSHDDIDQGSIQTGSFGHDDIDHSSVQLPGKKEGAENDGGLLGKMYSGFHELAVGSKSPVLNAMDLAGQGVSALSKAGGEAIRSRVLGEKNGHTLSGDEYLESKGIPKGPSATLPTKWLIGRDVEASPRAAAGGAIDLATDPTTYLLAGEGKIAGALEKIPEAGQWIAKKGAKAFASIPEETTARYFENPEAIRNAPSSKEISDRVMGMKDAADKGVADAHDELSNAKQALSDAKLDSRAGIQDQKFQTGNDLNEAQANFNEKKQQFKETLKSNNLTSLASDVTQATADLADKVSSGSSEGFSILGKSKETTSVDPIISSIQKNIDSLKLNGVPKGPGEAQAIDALRAEQTRLFEMTKGSDGKLTMPQAKEMLQSWDRRTSYPSQAGDLSSDHVNDALKSARGQLNQDVRAKVPEYAQHMDENVAPQTALLKKVGKLYGTPESAIQNLNGIDSEKGQAIHAPLLEELSKTTGKDLSSSVDGYLYNQKVLKTPSLFDQLVESTPEARALIAARSKMGEVSNPEFSRGIIEKSTEPIQKKIEVAGNKFDAAKTTQEDFKGITPDSVTAKQRQLTGTNNYGAESRWKNIDQKYGTNFENEIRARNDADAFSKDNTRGSRNAVMGGALGALLGSLGGHEGMWVGGAIGSTTGGFADKYAGPLTKFALDRGIDTGKAIRSVAKGMKETTAPAKAAAILKFPEGSGATIPRAADKNQDAPTKGPAKWQADGLKNLQDHVKTDDDRAAIEKTKEQLMSTPEGKKLLIAASDLKPGSRAMEDILSRVKKKFGEAK